MKTGFPKDEEGLETRKSPALESTLKRFSPTSGPETPCHPDPLSVLRPRFQKGSGPETEPFVLRPGPLSATLGPSLPGAPHQYLVHEAQEPSPLSPRPSPPTTHHHHRHLQERDQELLRHWVLPMVVVLRLLVLVTLSVEVSRTPFFPILFPEGPGRTKTVGGG